MGMKIILRKDETVAVLYLQVIISYWKQKIHTEFQFLKMFLFNQKE